MITDNITGRQTQSKQPQQSQRHPRHRGLESGHPPDKWGFASGIWGPEGWVVFTVTPDTFFNCSPPGYAALAKWENEG